MLRPWPADDGGLVRLRLPGGRVPTAALRALVAFAEEYGDARVRVTGRANLQVRALPLRDGVLPDEVVAAIAATGLWPSPDHDLARNVLASPQTGRAGGRADLRPVVAELDEAICTDPALAALPGRFLFTLDDGRGDLHDRHRDLGLVALDATTAQLRIGDGWGPMVTLDDAADLLASLARAFLGVRGTGPDAAWHVDELDQPLLTSYPCAGGADVRSDPLPHGPVPGGTHVAVDPDQGIDADLAAVWAALTEEVVVTPWHGVLVPEEDR